MQLALTLAADQPGYATCTIATLFGFTAIGIEDPVVHVIAGLPGRFEPQQLVEADTAPPVRERADTIGGGQREPIAANQDEVVPEPVHFCERNAHGVINPGSA